MRLAKHQGVVLRTWQSKGGGLLECTIVSRLLRQLGFTVLMLLTDEGEWNAATGTETRGAAC